MVSSQERSRRDRRSLLISAVVYVPTLVAADAYAEAVETGVLLFVPALLAGLAMILFATRSVRHGDELQRLIHLEALSFAFVALAVACFVLALLAAPSGDLLPARIRWIHLWIVMSCLWCAGLGLAHWRHR